MSTHWVKSLQKVGGVIVSGLLAFPVLAADVDPAVEVESVFAAAKSQTHGCRHSGFISIDLPARSCAVGSRSTAAGGESRRARGRDALLHFRSSGMRPRLIRAAATPLDQSHLA